MKKVRYIGEGGKNVGEYFPQISKQPEVGEIMDVPDWWEHPRTEEITDDIISAVAESDHSHPEA